MNYHNMLKRALPVMAFVCAGLMAACEKNPEATQEPNPDEEPVPEPDPYDGPMDSIKVLTYTRNNVDSLEYKIVMKYANDPRVTRIIYFLDSTNFNNDLRNRTDIELHSMRNFLEKTINYAPDKAVGAGTYVIYPGRIYQDDSIWIITHGWKIRSIDRYYGD